MHEEVKAWLQRYGELWNEIDDISARRNALALRATAARTSELDGLPHGQGGRSDPTGNTAILLTELDREINNMVAEAKCLYDEIEGTVKQLRGRGSADMRCIIRCRYIDGFPWSETAEILFGHREDFNERYDTFLRRTHLIHQKALAALSDFLHL